MKYLAYIVWLFITGILVVTVLPMVALALNDLEQKWFDIGDRILGT